MTGRGRTRASAQTESEASASLRRPTTRQGSTAVDEAAMAPPPARATRSTRGQSKDDVTNGVAGDVRTTPTAAASRVEHLAGASSEEGSLPEGLYTQPEEDDEDDEHFEDAVDGSQNQHAAGDLANRDMTPRTSFRQSQTSQSQRYSRASSALGSDVFLQVPGGNKALARVLQNFLPQLFKAADEVQNHLYYQSGDDAWSIELEAYQSIFTTFCERYSNNSFIDEEDILTKLGVTHGDSAVALDASRTIGAANIAILLYDIYMLRYKGLPDNLVLTELQRWDEDFPTSFLPRRQQGSPSWTSSDEDFSLALELRTQRLIYTLGTHGAGHGILSWLASIWFGTGNNPDSPEFDAFLNDGHDLSGEDDDGTMPLKAIAGLSLMDPRNRQYRERYVKRLRELYSVLRKSNDLPAQLDELKAVHQPLEQLMTTLNNWGHELFSSIKKMHHRSSSDRSAIAGGLFGAAETRSSVPFSQIPDSQDGSQVDPQMYSQSVVDGSHNVQDDDPDEYLMQIGRAAGEQARLSMQGGHQVPAVPPSAQHPPPGQSSQDFPSVDVIIAQRAMAHPPSSAYQADTSNYPPLADMGYSVSPAPARPQGSGALFASSAALTASQLVKRPRTSQDDDGFETDTRTPNDRLPEEAVTPKPRRKRQKINKPEPDLERINGTPGSNSQNMASSLASDVDLVALSQKARRETQNARKPKEPQTRTPWTRADCKRLIMAVDTYKCKWSLMEQMISNGTIPFEYPRNQQALRDKARLLKQDFLKTDSVLPLSFDYVVLGKKERQAVIACGRNPDRKEDDVDEDGKPTNTLYTGDGNEQSQASPGENELQRDHGQQTVQGNQRLNQE